MAADLFLALSRLTETPADLWEEDQAISPFESGWMQPTVAVPSAPHIHRVTNTPSSQLLLMYDDNKLHVGHASGDHFFIRFEAAEVNLDFKATLLNMVYQLCNSPAVHRPTPSYGWRHAPIHQSQQPTSPPRMDTDGSHEPTIRTTDEALTRQLCPLVCDMPNY